MTEPELPIIWRDETAGGPAPGWAQAADDVPMPTVEMLLKWGQVDVAEVRPMGTIKALDFSSGALSVTPSWCAARIAEGITLAIADLWSGRSTFPGAEQALRYWRDAGGVTAGYLCVHDVQPAAYHVERAKAAAGAEWAHLAFVAIDVEVYPTSAETVRAAADLIAANGLRAIVYSSPYDWQVLVGADMPDLLEWVAEYDSNVDLAPAFAGGTVVGHQYQGSTVLDGILVDYSVFREEFVMDMSDADRTKLIAALDAAWSAKEQMEAATATLFAAIVAIKEATGIQPTPAP